MQYRSFTPAAILGMSAVVRTATAARPFSVTVTGVQCVWLVASSGCNTNLNN
jgi:hypothetical protein